MEKPCYEAVRDVISVLGDGSTVRTLINRDIARLEQKLAELDALYVRRRAELRERIERLEKIRERMEAKQ